MSFQILANTGVLSASDTLNVTLIGLLAVFAILAILIGFIELLHVLLKDRKQKREPVEERIAPGVIAEVPSAGDAPDDPEFLAAVSAAISAVIGTRSFIIRSVSEK